MSALRIEFEGEWNRQGPTAGGRAPIVVAESPYSPTDVEMRAGCQGGYMSIKSAIAAAAALLKVAKARAASIPPFAVRITRLAAAEGAADRVWVFENAAEIVANNTTFSVLSANGALLTGPHMIDRFRVEWIPNPAAMAFSENPVPALDACVIDRIRDILDAKADVARKYEALKNLFGTNPA